MADGVDPGADREEDGRRPETTVSGIVAKKPSGSVTTRCQRDGNSSNRRAAFEFRRRHEGPLIGAALPPPSRGAVVKAEAVRADAESCYAAALVAVAPAVLLRAVSRASRDTLTLRTRGGDVLATHRGPVLIVGAGKAALAMARAAHRRRRRHLSERTRDRAHGAERECPGGVAVCGGATRCRMSPGRVRRHGSWMPCGSGSADARGSSC